MQPVATRCRLDWPNCCKPGHSAAANCVKTPAGCRRSMRLCLRNFNHGRWHHHTWMNHRQFFGLTADHWDMAFIRVPSHPLHWGWGSGGSCWGCGPCLQLGCWYRSWLIAGEGWPGCPSLGSGCPALEEDTAGTCTYCCISGRTWGTTHGSFTHLNELAVETVLKLKSTTCSVGWWLDCIVLLFLDKLEGHCAEVALILNHQVTECDNKLLSADKGEFHLVHLIMPLTWEQFIQHCWFLWAHTFTTTNQTSLKKKAFQTCVSKCKVFHFFNSLVCHPPVENKKYN